MNEQSLTSETGREVLEELGFTDGAASDA